MRRARLVALASIAMMVLSYGAQAFAQEPPPRPFVPKNPWEFLPTLSVQAGALGGSPGISHGGGDALWLGADLWLGLFGEQWQFWTRLEQRWGWMRQQDEALVVQKWRDRWGFGGAWRPAWTVAPKVGARVRTSLFETTLRPQQETTLRYRDADGLELVRVLPQGAHTRLMRWGMPVHARQHVLASGTGESWHVGVGPGARQSFYWRGAAIERTGQGGSEVALLWLDDKLQGGIGWEVGAKGAWSERFEWIIRGQGFIPGDLPQKTLWEWEGRAMLPLGEAVWLEYLMQIEREDEQVPWQWQQGLGVRLGGKNSFFF